MFDGFCEWLWHHDHSGAAAVGWCVDGSVFVGGEVSWVCELDVDDVVLDGASDDALGEWTVEHFGE